MPRREVHELVERMLLGRSYGWVDRLMDLPSLWLGPRHRRLLHDEETAVLIALASRDPRAYLAAKLHILLDKKYSGARRLRRGGRRG